MIDTLVFPLILRPLDCMTHFSHVSPMMVRYLVRVRLKCADSMEKSLSTFAAEMATSAMVLGECLRRRS